MGGLDFIIKLRGKEYYMDSPLENLMLLLKACMAIESATPRDTINTLRAGLGCYNSTGTLYGWMYFNPQPPAGTDTYGIQVGSDNTAVVINDYKLNTQIISGNGAGQLAYGAQALTYGGAGANKWAKITRTFTNNTANPIDVKECGYVIKPYNNTGNIMITRDVISPTITVAAADTLPIELYIQTTA